MTKGLVVAIQRVKEISKRIETNSKLLNDTCWSQYISGSILIKSNFVFKCVTTTTSRSHSCFDVNAAPLRKDRMSQQPISGECCSNAALPCPTKQDDAGFALHLACPEECSKNHLLVFSDNCLRLLLLPLCKIGVACHLPPLPPLLLCTPGFLPFTTLPWPHTMFMFKQ